MAPSVLPERLRARADSAGSASWEEALVAEICVCVLCFEISMLRVPEGTVCTVAAVKIILQSGKPISGKICRNSQTKFRP